VLQLLPAAMFVYSSCGKWVFPPLLWSFPPFATLTSFPTPGCWAHATAPPRGSPAHPACLFTVPGRIPFPQSSALSAPYPLSRVSLLFLLLISQFLFSLSGGLGMLLWPKLVCGSTTVPRSSPCPYLPKPSGRGQLSVRVPSLFLCLTWSGDSLRQLEVWRGSMFCLFSVILPAKCVSSVPPRFNYRRLTFCFLPLAAILESPCLMLLNAIINTIIFLISFSGFLLSVYSSCSDSCVLILYPIILLNTSANSIFYSFRSFYKVDQAVCE
jgi:hypothetical protein